MKKTYEVIIDTDVLNDTGEAIRKAQVGDEVSGEIVNVDGSPYLELKEDAEYIDMKSLAEKLEKKNGSGDSSDIAHKVKASNKKIVFAIMGAAVGFATAYAMKMDTKKKVLLTVGGFGAGLLAEYAMSLRNK